MTRGHATIMGGSNFKRRVHCRGSYHAEKNAPPSEPSYYAAEGTACHSVMEELVLRPDLDPAHFVGTTYEVDGFTITIDEDMVDELIHPALDAYCMIRDMAGRPDPSDILVEPKVGFAEGVWGSLDLGVRGENDTVFADWKFGRGIVDATDNWQLSFYASAALFGPTRDPTLLRWREALPSDEHVILAIVQPQRDPVLEFERVPLSRLRGVAELALEASRDNVRPDAPRAAGDWCTWCRARPVCTTYTDEFMSKIVNTDFQGISSIDLAVLAAKVDQAEAWVKAFRAFEHRALTAGISIPNRKLVWKRARRAWNVDEAELIKAARRCKIKKKELYDHKLKSPAQLEKQHKNNARWLDTLPELVSKVSSGTTAVSADDPREAVNVSKEDAGRLIATLDKMMDD